MEYCCHVWAGACSCYLELLDKLQKWICRSVGLSLAASLELLAHRRNEASLILFNCYYFGSTSLFLREIVVILINCMNSLSPFLDVTRMSLSPFLDVTRMSMSTVSFFPQLDSGILFLQMLSFDL